MADETQTPAPTDPTVENAALRGALAKVQADYDTLKGETQIVATAAESAKSALGAALIERDTFKAQVGKLEPVAKEAETLRVQVQGFINTGREKALLAALDIKNELVGTVLDKLTVEGRANKYPEDPAAEAVKVKDIITKEYPSLLQPTTVTTAGGSAVLSEKKANTRPVVRNLVTGH